LDRGVLHKGIFLLLIIALAGSGAGKTLFARSFVEMGYQDFTVDGPNRSACTTAKFLLPADVNAESPAAYPILSLAVDFGPVARGAADVNAFLNGEKIAQIAVKDFRCNGALCWERIALPKEKLNLLGENSIDACLETTDSVAKAVLKGESMIGLYNTADFSGGNAFAASAQKESLVIGEKTKITLSLHNRGSAAAFAEIRHARPVASDKNVFFVVEGDTRAETFVKAGETASISYIIKPRVAGKIRMPPPIVYYKNEFGEEEQQFGNVIELDIREPERKIEAFIVKQKEANTAGTKIDLLLAVKNVGRDALYDLAADLKLPAELLLLQQPEIWIPEIEPQATVYIPFSVSSGKAGKFQVNCTVTYTDANITETKCENSFVEFNEGSISPIIYIGAIMLIIGVGAYAYIMRGGEKKPGEEAAK